MVHESKILLTDPKEKKPIGKVSPEERDQIRTLFERKNGLIELFRSFGNLSKDEIESSPLYDKIIKDMGDVSTRFQQWWDEKSIKYNWENIPGHKWEIDFPSCSVFLIKQNQGHE